MNVERKINFLMGLSLLTPVLLGLWVYHNWILLFSMPREQFAGFFVTIYIAGFANVGMMMRIIEREKEMGVKNGEAKAQ